MKPLVVAALLLLSCSTRPLEPSDDLAPADLAKRDSAADLSLSPCARCHAESQLCVFVSRGDCSMYECAPAPAGCSGDLSCGCLGDGFCAHLAQSGEQLKCTPKTEFPPGPDVICTSTIQCV